MADAYGGASDNLRWLKDEVERLRKLGRLGDAHPDSNDKYKDMQAESINNIVDMVIQILGQMNHNETNKPPWYHPEEMLGLVFGKHAVRRKSERKAEKLIERAMNLTLTTARFRERYACTYKAAFDAILPEQTIAPDVCVWTDNLQSYGLESSIGIGLRNRRSLSSPNYNAPSRLDVGHALDQKLVVLSVNMARILDTTRSWQKTFGDETTALVCNAAKVLESLLVASQTDILIRFALPKLLNDASRITDLLNDLVSLEELLNTVSLSITKPSMRGQNQKATGEHLKDEELQTVQRRTNQMIDKLESQINFWASYSLASFNANKEDSGAYNCTSNGAEIDELVSPYSPCQHSLTFESTTHKMESFCVLKKFYKRDRKQCVSSGVAFYEGSFAVVHRVRLNKKRNFVVSGKGRLGGIPVQTVWSFDEVAVKVLNRSDTEQQICLRALRELVVWSQMRHPHIVPLVGLWFNFNEQYRLPAFVAPWLDHETLLTYLESKATRRQQRLKLLLDVAEALAYMHNNQPSVSHGDITPVNILVSNNRAFICDFGISHISEPYRGLTTYPHGDWRYRAPERLKYDPVSKSKPTPQSDIYSFGLLCYRVFTGLHPYHGMESGSRTMNPRLVPQRLESITDDDYSLLRYCWEQDPRLRATANIVIDKLNALIDLEIE